MCAQVYAVHKPFFGSKNPFEFQESKLNFNDDKNRSYPKQL